MKTKQFKLMILKYIHMIQPDFWKCLFATIS